MKNKIESLLNRIWRVKLYTPNPGTYALFRMWYNSAPRWYRWLRREKAIYKDGELFYRMREEDVVEMGIALKHYATTILTKENDNV